MNLACSQASAYLGRSTHGTPCSVTRLGTAYVLIDVVPGVNLADARDPARGGLEDYLGYGDQLEAVTQALAVLQASLSKPEYEHLYTSRREDRRRRELVARRSRVHARDVFRSLSRTAFLDQTLQDIGKVQSPGLMPSRPSPSKEYYLDHIRGRGQLKSCHFCLLHNIRTISYSTISNRSYTLTSSAILLALYPLRLDSTIFLSDDFQWPRQALVFSTTCSCYGATDDFTGAFRQLFSRRDDEARIL